MTDTITADDVTGICADYLDCCLSDYFMGSDAHEVLAIPVSHDTTYQQAREELEHEFLASGGWFDDVENCGDLFTAALDDLFAPVADRMDSVADFVRYIEPCGDDDCAPSVYLYVALRAESE